MTTQYNIKTILVHYKSDEYINFLYDNIVGTYTTQTIYPKFLKKFLESHYNISLAGGPNPGQSRYWIVRGFSTEEAEILKKDISSKYACNSIDAIMKRHNVDITTANIMKKEMTDKGINTLNEKYTANELTIINSKKQITLENMITKYGKEEGTIRYNNCIDKRKDSNTLDGYIKRYGEEQGTIMHTNFISHMENIHTLESHIERYGKEEGTIRYNETSRKKSYSSTIDFYIEKYGETEGTIKFNERQEKWQTSLNKTMVNSRTPNKRFRASKESLAFLIPIYKFIRKNGINKENIYIGAGGRREYIKTYKSTIVAYDFVVEPLKLVIEYDGAAFHPKSINEENWIHPYHKEGPEQYYIKDQEKKEFMVNKGFKYFVIRSDDTGIIKQEKTQDIINYIKANML